MRVACRRGSVVALLLFSGACSLPTSPTRTPTVGVVSPPVPVPTPPVSDFPPVAGPAQIYLAASSLPGPSRYVLYGDNRFALQYLGLGEYHGTYKAADGVVTFAWDGGGSWGAAGSLTDDALTVRYNTAMQLSDFEDATYVRQR